jgi:hypothetical protein
MSAAESSLLFYILDGLRSSPCKSQDILGRVNNLEGRSDEFIVHISFLSNAKSEFEVLAAEKIVRAKIL